MVYRRQIEAVSQKDFQLSPPPHLLIDANLLKSDEMRLLHSFHFIVLRYVFLLIVLFFIFYPNIRK